MTSFYHFVKFEFLDSLSILYFPLFFFFFVIRVLARVGEHVNFEVCMDVLDLLYEKEATSVLYNSPCFLAASILACLYISPAEVSLTFCFLLMKNVLRSLPPFTGRRIRYFSTCTEVGIPYSSLG